MPDKVIIIKNICIRSVYIWELFESLLPFSHDVMAALLVPLNKETVAMLVSQINPHELSPIQVQTFSFVSTEKHGSRLGE